MVFNILPWGDIIEAMKTTFFMVSISLFIGTILAVILAFALVLTNDGGLWENRYVFYGLNSVISLIRSLPFIILMTFIFPFTKMIVGTRIGATAALVPLVCFIVPYLARLFENSLLGVDKGIIRAAKAMGANYFQIIWYFILPEAFYPAGSQKFHDTVHNHWNNFPDFGYGSGRNYRRGRNWRYGADVWV